MGNPIRYCIAKTVFLDADRTLEAGLPIATVTMEDVPGFNADGRFLADGIRNGTIVPEAKIQKQKPKVRTPQTPKGSVSGVKPQPVVTVDEVQDE